MVITNNPLVRSRLDDTHEVIYLELSYEELLKVVRDRIYEAYGFQFSSFYPAIQMSGTDAGF